ncbi:uncharacterized protein LOC123663660 [Melitaea cinxia]|uniref:uncharacterized protein LOC123663660 n=1 Tax=Melitaea cinxia TaxID=113334 RepID=UPI001E27329E|nr:uncharacterized protein LOC123663660 [Melitaea cinxia]
MDSVSNCTLLEVTKEQILAVRRDCNLDTQQLNENVDILENWCRSQDQLVEALPYLGRNILERFLIKEKGSLERAKQAIDKALAVRGMMPEFLLNEETKITLEKFYNLFDNVLITSLPKVNPKDGTRIFLSRIMNDNFEDINLIEKAKFTGFFLDVRMTHDYVFSDRLVFDLQHLKPSVIKLLNPIVLKKVNIFFMGAYKFKIKGIHILNAPSFFDKVFFILKGFFEEKLVERVNIHSSYEDLYKQISKEILPKEYGGESMSFADLIEEWKKYLKSDVGKRIIENSKKLVSDESKRSLFKFDEEYFGLPGSFKQIKID